MFILSLANQSNWVVKVGEKEVTATLKLRFFYAPELQEKISEFVRSYYFEQDITTKMYLLDLLKVHKRTIVSLVSYKGCKTPEQKDEKRQQVKRELIEKANKEEQGFYASVLKTINDSITIINQIYTTKNIVLKGNGSRLP